MSHDDPVLQRLQNREKNLTEQINALAESNRAIVQLVRNNKLGAGHGFEYRKIGGAAIPLLVKMRKDIRRKINDRFLFARSDA